MTRASMIKEKVMVCDKQVELQLRSKGPFPSRLPSSASSHSPQSPQSLRATLGKTRVAIVPKTKPASTTSGSCESAACRAACSS